MIFPLTGRVIKSGVSTKNGGKPWANILIEGKDGAADVCMLFPLQPVAVGSIFKGQVDGQVQFCREVSAIAEKK